MDESRAGKRKPVSMDEKARRGRRRELRAERDALTKIIDDAKVRRAEIDAERKALQEIADPKTT